jgi:hypothetical protein
MIENIKIKPFDLVDSPNQHENINIKNDVSHIEYKDINPISSIKLYKSEYLEISQINDQIENMD